MTNNNRKYKHTTKKKQKRIMSVNNKKKNKTLRKHTHKSRKTKKSFHLKGGEQNTRMNNNDIEKMNYMDYMKHHFSTPKQAKLNKIDSNNDIYYYELHPKTKVITFGDVHGDLPLLVTYLTLSGVMKSSIKIPTPNKNGIRNIEEMQHYFNQVEWTGESTMVVQLGDQIDRSRDTENHSSYEDEGSTFEIVYLLLLLNQLAQKHNNNTKQKYVFSMLGNHELMNVMGDMSYVSKSERRVFNERLGQSTSSDSSTSNNLSTTESSANHKGISDKHGSSYWRRHAYKPGHLMANLMAFSYHTLLQIGPFLFVHGGITKDLLKTDNMNLSTINKTVKQYLYGELDKGKNSKNSKNIEAIIGNSGLLWDRTLSQESHKSMKNSDNLVGTKSISNRDSSKSSLKTTLKEYLRNVFDIYHKRNPNLPKITLICVGHTPQYFVKEHANLLFHDKYVEQLNHNRNTKKYELNESDVLRLDTASSRAFGQREAEYLRDPVIASMNTDGTNVMVNLVRKIFKHKE